MGASIVGHQEEGLKPPKITEDIQGVKANVKGGLKVPAVTMMGFIKSVLNKWHERSEAEMCAECAALYKHLTT